ncbi:four helix bundle suffix domain-containing protein [Sedimentisphaera salicampi]|uniref:four helix bundle suffix domain-containing protein n=1 Tax=Sedimentisphaera salicampi TaxID=1941349 RepID=UPI000A2707C0|nr:four helix bundle suffix domain-containing protein [Sedimentisphaera salicampi]
MCRRFESVPNHYSGFALESLKNASWEFSGAFLIAKRLKSADEAAYWIAEVKQRIGPSGLAGLGEFNTNTGSSPPAETEIAFAYLIANSAITLINIACGLLKKQINSLAEAFESEGGFTERLYATRKKKKGS